MCIEWRGAVSVPHDRSPGAQMLIPDYLVYEELKRREEEERAWTPEPLHLPLWAPETHDSDSDVEDIDEYNINRGVVIIDMNSVDEIG